jgi:lysophospholipase L1-like esterase
MHYFTRLRWLLIALPAALWLVLSTLLTPPALSLAAGAPPATVRVMPLGDSITESWVTGSLNNPSYRYFLWNRLTTAGYAVDFVGSRTTRSNGTNLYLDFDFNHQGISGVRVDELTPGGSRHAATVSAIQAADPDIVLLHLGTNDLIQNREIPAIVQHVSTLIDMLRATNPNVTVLLAQVITCQYNGCTPTRVTQYNAQLSTLAASKTSAASPVIIVDQHGAVPLSELPDKVHPSATGERLMAERWFQALSPRLPASPGVSVDNSVAGGGLDAFSYSGAWTTCSGCDPHAVGLFGGGFSSSSSSGATAQFQFTRAAGGQVKLYLVKTAASGVAAISLNGGPETLVDLYAGSDRRYTAVWVSAPLSAGTHTLQVRVTGTKQAASAGTAVGIDRVELFGSAPSQPPTATFTAVPIPPTATATATPTATPTEVPPTATATEAPTVTPTEVPPTATATQTPTATPTDVPASGPGFYRAININGPAALIDGNAWEAQSGVSTFTINGSARSNPWITPSPATDPARVTMLRSFQHHWAISAALAEMPAGAYEVYLYVIQDWNNPSPPLVTFSLEGQVVGTYRAGGAGSWERLGPYPVTVSDGTLNLNASQIFNLSGIEIHR